MDYEARKYTFGSMPKSGVIANPYGACEIVDRSVFESDVYHEFEGRKFYSYNNIEKVLKQWYGPNCLKKWDGKKWVETYPVEKRKPKHTKDLNLNGECSIGKR